MIDNRFEQGLPDYQYLKQQFRNKLKPSSKELHGTVLKPPANSIPSTIPLYEAEMSPFSRSSNSPNLSNGSSTFSKSSLPFNFMGLRTMFESFQSSSKYSSQPSSPSTSHSSLGSSGPLPRSRSSPATQAPGDGDPKAEKVYKQPPRWKVRFDGSGPPPSTSHSPRPKRCRRSGKRHTVCSPINKSNNSPEESASLACSRNKKPHLKKSVKKGDHGRSDRKKKFGTMNTEQKSNNSGKKFTSSKWKLNLDSDVPTTAKPVQFKPAEPKPDGNRCQSGSGSPTAKSRKQTKALKVIGPDSTKDHPGDTFDGNNTLTKILSKRTKRRKNRRRNRYETAPEDQYNSSESQQSDGPNSLNGCMMHNYGLSKPVRNSSRRSHHCHNQGDIIWPELELPQNERDSKMMSARPGGKSSPAVARRECQRESCQRCDEANSGRLDAFNGNSHQNLNRSDSFVLGSHDSQQLSEYEQLVKGQEVPDQTNNSTKIPSYARNTSPDSTISNDYHIRLDCSPQLRPPIWKDCGGDRVAEQQRKEAIEELALVRKRLSLKQNKLRMESDKKLNGMEKIQGAHNWSKRESFVVTHRQVKLEARIGNLSKLVRNVREKLAGQSQRYQRFQKKKMEMDELRKSKRMELFKAEQDIKMLLEEEEIYDAEYEGVLEEYTLQDELLQIALDHETRKRAIVDQAVEDLTQENSFIRSNLIGDDEGDDCPVQSDTSSPYGISQSVSSIDRVVD